MIPAQRLAEQVRTADASKISLPVLRELVLEVQAKSPDQVRREGQYWTDNKWSQWRQHSSHNPW